MFTRPPSAHERPARSSALPRLRRTGAGWTLCLAICWTIAQPAASFARNCRAACPVELSAHERLERFVFAPTVSTSGYTLGLVYAARGYSWRSLREINQYNIRSAHVVAGTAQSFELNEPPLESQYWWSIHSVKGARPFIRGLAAALEVELANPDRLTVDRDLTILEKALAQRDAVQAYGLLVSAAISELDEETRLMATRIEGSLVTLVRSLLLTKVDYRQLRSELPKKIPRRFSSVPSDQLADSYLPLRAIARDDSWLEIHGGPDAFRHYTSYGGRSFIKIYMRAPALANDQIEDLWRLLFRKYGRDLHVTGVDQATPVGLETMLVRTFGVFLEDGSFLDSTWPEEVTIRRLKHPAERIDAASSDFRGTQFFQYKLSRSLAVKDPASLGLRRVLDDDKQFFGFFATYLTGPIRIPTL